MVRDFLPFHVYQYWIDLRNNRDSAFRNENEHILEFYKSWLKRDDLVFDIGANVGRFVRIYHKLGARIVAVEPQEHCVRYLRSRFGKVATIEPVGLGAETGTLKLYISPSHTISSFSTDWMKAVNHSGRFGKNSWDKTQHTSIVTLDSLIAKHGKPRYVKIDVEGFELQVLKGLTSPVDFLSIEYTVPEMSESTLECIRLLNDRFPKSRYNYEPGFTHRFALSEWINGADFLDHLKSEAFQKTGGGDIFVRNDR